MANDEIVPITAHENVEENTAQGVDASNVRPAITTIQPRRSLPPGKEYHIFISYESSDRPYVLRLKAVLDGLGFKCMLADHDFRPGVSIMQNIERAIETSHKLLMVVSKHFLRSKFCDKEVDIAHTYAATNDRDDFMIVLRLDDTRMPLKLEYMTYVNGVDMKIEDVGRKVEDAYAGLAVSSSQSQNGRDILRKDPQKMSQRLRCSSSYEFNDLSQIDRKKLESSSIEESSTCYREMLKCANSMFLFKILATGAIYGSIRERRLFLSFLCLGVLTLFGSGYLFFTRSIKLQMSLLGLVLCALGLLTLQFWFWSLAALCLSCRIVHKLYSVVRKNTDFKSQNYLVLPRRAGIWISISFNYYNMKPCWNFLEERARACWPNASEEDIDNKCRDELSKTIFESVIASSFNAIPRADFVRHATYHNTCCLCQCSRSSWTKEPSRLSVHQGQGTESVPNEENESTAIGHKTYSPTENDETSVKNVFGIDNCNYKPTEENDETCVMEIACNEHGRNSSNSHGTSLTGAVGGRLLESNTDQWYPDMCESHVSGEATTMQNTQVSLEMINLEKNTVNFSENEMSTSFNRLGEDVTLHSEDEGRQCFRGEHFIDEETHM